MSVSPWLVVVAALLGICAAPAYRRWLLWRAETGAALRSRWLRAIAARLPAYTLGDRAYFAADAAPDDVAARRRYGFERLAARFRKRSPRSIAASETLRSSLSDAALTSAYRIPFPFRNRAIAELEPGAVVESTSERRIRDIDGVWSYDLTGAYGVNVLGYETYKSCMAAAVERAGELGPVLGPWHPIVADNVERLRTISRLDEISFHMSGTEAVMQAVRLARFNTGRSHLVRFSGAYHGWWDGVQAGFGNERTPGDVYTLRDMSRASLRVLERCRDIACVLVNPLQAMHPNAAAPGDGTLLDSSRHAHFDKAAYAHWLAELREVCDRRGIALIFDEVFIGFRLARGGAQEYFGVRADLVTYGKTLGGGLPVGVVCGTHALMQRFDARHPARICFARGTFNAHPYVMAAMNEFLLRLDRPEIAAHYTRLDATWNARAERLNERLAAAALPVRLANLASIWTVLYERPSRYNWMFQYYLREAGLMLSWIGTGRLIFSHDYTEDDFEAVASAFVTAAERMERDGWWWQPSGATNRGLRRALARELVGAWLSRSRSAPSSP